MRYLIAKLDKINTEYALMDVNTYHIQRDFLTGFRIDIQLFR